MANLPPKVKLKWNQPKKWKGKKRTKSPNEALYHSEQWTEASKAFRAGKQCARAGMHPKCQKTPDIVDHIRNAAIFEDVDFWDKSNWQVLCRSCSAAKTNKETAIKKMKNKQK